MAQIPREIHQRVRLDVRLSPRATLAALAWAAVVGCVGGVLVGVWYR